MKTRSQAKAAAQQPSGSAFDLPKDLLANEGGPPPGADATKTDRELEKAMRAQDPTRAPELHAPPAADSAPLPTLQTEVRHIIETVFQIDLESTWKRLHAALAAGEGKQYSPRAWLKVIDDRCREAHKLYCNLKLALERYKQDVESTQAAMRSEANDILQDEKDQGLRKKAITNDDVRAKMIELHPDEFHGAELELRKFSLAVEHAESLITDLRQKARSLQVEANYNTAGFATDD
jgi:hypothetical protein